MTWFLIFNLIISALQKNEGVKNNASGKRLNINLLKFVAHLVRMKVRANMLLATFAFQLQEMQLVDGAP